VVGEHDSAAADTDGAGGGGDVPDENSGCGARQPIDGVVLSEPEAAVAPLLGVPGEIDGAGDSRGWGFAGVHADEIKDGDGERHRVLDVAGKGAIQGGKNHRNCESAVESSP
jgi:hypothetical protein